MSANARQTRQGVCHLCGQVSRLSFEHIPPKRVFNDRPLVLRTVDDMARRWKGPSRFRRGMGRRTLCEACNGRTADLYGEAFAEWTRQALSFVGRIGPNPVLSLPFDIFPLRVLKQVLTMALAATGAGEPRRCGELQRMILCPHQRYLPYEYGVFAYFNPTGGHRLAGNVAVLRTNRGLVNYVLAEVAFPPMGYCVVRLDAQDPSIPRQEGLCDIGFFSRFGYHERRTVWLTMSKRTPAGPFPLAYPEARHETSVDGGSAFVVGRSAEG